MAERLWYELDIWSRLRWLPHNLIAHPMMVILPRTWGQQFHDFTLPEEP